MTAKLADKIGRPRRAGLMATLTVFALGISACGGAAGSGDTGAGSPPPQSPGPTSGNSSAQASVRFVTVASDKSFQATTAALKKSVKQAGSQVLVDFNHAKVLSQRTTLDVDAAHAFWIGKPAMGKKVFQIDRAIGAAVPLRMYVWRDTDGTTKIGYFDPRALFTAINPKLADAGKKMSRKLNTIAHNAT